MADKTATTEVNITGDSDTLVAILQNQYGKLTAEEARAALEQAYQRAWSESEFAGQFVAEKFEPPYVHVLDKMSGQRGTMIYLDSPRFYFLFNPEGGHE